MRSALRHAADHRIADPARSDCAPHRHQRCDRFDQNPRPSRARLLGFFVNETAAHSLRHSYATYRLAATVAADKAKTATRRLVPILPNLAEYLRSYHSATGRMFKIKDDKRAIAFAKKIGVQPWPIN